MSSKKNLKNEDFAWTQSQMWGGFRSIREERFNQFILSIFEKVINMLFIHLDIDEEEYV